MSALRRGVPAKHPGFRASSCRNTLRLTIRQAAGVGAAVRGAHRVRVEVLGDERRAGAHGDAVLHRRRVRRGVRRLLRDAPSRVGPHARVLLEHGLPGHLRVVRGAGHPERGAGACAARAGVAVPQSGIGARRAVQRASVRRAGGAQADRGIRADFRRHPGQRDVPPP